MKTGKLQSGPVDLIEIAGRSITVTQGQNELFGSYTKSNNERYILTYCDGNQTYGEWENGEICLIEQSQSSTVLWSKPIERPDGCMVSNDGKVVVNDGLQYTGELRGLFYAFSREGNLLIEQRFDSNLCSCAISDDGKYASASLAFPNNHIYCYNLENMKPIWKYENHSKSPVLGLSFSSGYMLDVYTGKTEATKIKNYSINIDGKLDNADAQRLKGLQTLKKK